MSFGAKKIVADPEPENTGVEDEQASTASEAIPIPMLFGERIIAVRWMSRVYNQRAVEAPASRPGKKG